MDGLLHFAVGPSAKDIADQIRADRLRRLGCKGVLITPKACKRFSSLITSVHSRATGVTQLSRGTTYSPHFPPFMQGKRRRTTNHGHSP